MPIQGQMTEKDFLAAQYLHMRPSAGKVAAWLVSLGFCGVVFAWAGTLLYFALFLGILAVVYMFVVPYKSRRFFREFKALAEPVTMEVREDGVFFKRTNGEGLVPWAHVVKWRSNDKLVLLYQAKTMFTMVPSRFFASAEDYRAFLATLTERVGRES